MAVLGSAGGPLRQWMRRWLPAPAPPTAPHPTAQARALLHRRLVKTERLRSFTNP